MICKINKNIKVMCGHQRDDDVVEDFCDSVHAKAHPIFGRDKTALQLLLFYDELEVCNPIGSSRKKHKIGTYVYVFTIHGQMTWVLMKTVMEWNVTKGLCLFI